MTGAELLRTAIAVEHDVFTVRQCGREVAAAVGLEGQDQVRVATALSEVGRQLLAQLGLVQVTFRLEPGSPPLLEIEATAVGVAGPALLLDLEPGRRLMDRSTIAQDENRVVVTMARQLPPASLGPTAATLVDIRTRVAALVPSTPLQELAVQNRNLLVTLEEIQAHRDELLRLNAELEETNRGVMALYTQLSDELETTNRGVVALYAELDEKSAQLRDASEAKSRFLANVSHELRAPATAIIGLMRLVLDPRSDPLTPDQRDQLELARGSADALLSLVNDLLDLAKAESGRIDPEWAEIDLGGVLQGLRGTMQPLVTNPDLRLVVEEPAAEVRLSSDEVLLTQILRNLLTNAIKFTSRGEVRLSVRHRGEDGLLELAVADTGIGIAAAEQERVFEEFYQVRSPGQPAIKGTGLGLPYARRLAGLLGGSLTLSSAPGQGSTFTLSLPTRHLDGAAPAPKRILLIADDDTAFRSAVVARLTDPSTRVVPAASGAAALAAIAAERPDLVLLGLRLPEVDGAQILDQLAADESLANIPVVVLTAFTQDVAHTAALPRAAAVLGRAGNALDELPALVRAALRRGGP